MTIDDQMAMLEQAIAEEGSQSAVAKKIGCSAATISQIVAGKYAGNPALILAKVEDAYGTRPVECPVLGTIAITRCAAERRTPFSASNPVRCRIYVACKGCVNNR